MFSLAIPLVLRVTSFLTCLPFCFKDVIFHETIFPFISTHSTFLPNLNIPLPHLFPSMASPLDPLFSFPNSDSMTNPIPTQDPISPIVDESISTIPNLDSVLPYTSTLPIPESQSPSRDVSMPSTDIVPSSPIVPTVDIPPRSLINPSVDVVSLRKSQRTSKPPAYLQSYKCSSVTCDQSTHFSASIKSGSSSTLSGIKYSLSNYLNSSQLSSSYANFCSLITNIVEPKSYYEAVKDPKWLEAMDAEIATLESNNTWTLTPLPLHKKAMGCKWVYRVKYRSDGSVERYK